MDPFDEKDDAKNDEKDDGEYESVIMIIYTPLGISWEKIVGGSCNEMLLYGMVFYCWFTKKDQENFETNICEHS